MENSHPEVFPMVQRKLLVVPSMSNNIVSVYDLESHQVVTQFGLPRRGTSGVFASPDGTKLYCLASGGCDLVVLDVATWQVDSVIPLEGMIVDRGTVPDQGRNFWASVILQGHIHAVDTVSGKVTSYLKAGPCFQISGDETHLFTLKADRRKKPGTFITRSLATGEIIAEVATAPMQGVPLGMWRHEGKVYWTELAKAGGMHVMDVSDPAAPRYVTRIPLGMAPLGARILANGTMWVPNSGDGTVSVIDLTTDQVVHTLDLNRFVSDITYDDGRVYLNQSTKPGRLGFWPAMYMIILAPYLGVYVTPRSGNPKTRRGLDRPAEVAAYDAETYEPLPLPVMKLPSIAFTSAVVVTTNAASEPAANVLHR
jgi:DNA-binding beta-propeller fold protein YncE